MSRWESEERWWVLPLSCPLLKVFFAVWNCLINFVVQKWHIRTMNLRTVFDFFSHAKPLKYAWNLGIWFWFCRRAIEHYHSISFESNNLRNITWFPQFSSYSGKISQFSFIISVKYFLKLMDTSKKIWNHWACWPLLLKKPCHGIRKGKTSSFSGVFVRMSMISNTKMQQSQANNSNKIFNFVTWKIMQLYSFFSDSY